MGNFYSAPSPAAQAADKPSFTTDIYAAKDPVTIATAAMIKPAQTVNEIWQASMSAAKAEKESIKSSSVALEAARKLGDTAGAKALLVKCKAHHAQAGRLKKQASEEIFNQLNHSRPPTHMDLHGQTVDAALKLVHKRMAVWRQQGVRSAMIIVGR